MGLGRGRESAAGGERRGEGPSLSLRRRAVCRPRHSPDALPRAVGPEDAHGHGPGRAPVDPVATGASEPSRHTLLLVEASSGHQHGPCASDRSVFVKPGTYDEWVAMVDNLNVYWLKRR